GPVPTAVSAVVNLPPDFSTLSTTSGQSMSTLWSARLVSVVTLWLLVVILTVLLSTASTLSRLARIDRLMNRGSLVRCRFRLKTMSSATSARPLAGGLLCHLALGGR